MENPRSAESTSGDSPPIRPVTQCKSEYQKPHPLSIESLTALWKPVTNNVTNREAAHTIPPFTHFPFGPGMLQYTSHVPHYISRSNAGGERESPNGITSHAERQSPVTSHIGEESSMSQYYEAISAPSTPASKDSGISSPDLQTPKSNLRFVFDRASTSDLGSSLELDSSMGSSRDNYVDTQNVHKPITQINASGGERLRTDTPTDSEGSISPSFSDHPSTPVTLATPHDDDTGKTTSLIHRPHIHGNPKLSGEEIGTQRNISIRHGSLPVLQQPGESLEKQHPP